MKKSRGYEIPKVFEEAHARGFSGFPLAPNPEELLDPRDPDRTLRPERYSHETVLKRRAPNANRQASLAEIEALKAKAEQVLAGSHRYEAQAVIGGMPVRLRTNSPHASNFWRRNWFLTDPAAVDAAAERYGVAVVRMWCALERRDPDSAGAYYCRETSECVFWNTDYYGQMKSWALGAAGAELARFGIHSIHGACVDINGHGVLIIAPTGTGKSTYTQLLAYVEALDPRLTGEINSDDWVYVKDGVATPSERHIYVRTNAVRDDLDEAAMDPGMAKLKGIFDASPAENVPVGAGRRLYSEVPNSRCMIDPGTLARVTFRTPIDLIVLLRRDDRSPFERFLSTEEALAVLEEGEFTVQPGAGPKEQWGKLAKEPWYNPYLLRPDREFERRMFASYQDVHGARYLIYNTGAAVCAREFGIKTPVEALTHEDYQRIIEGTGRRILERLEEVAAAKRRR